MPRDEMSLADGMSGYYALVEVFFRGSIIFGDVFSGPWRKMKATSLEIRKDFYVAATFHILQRGNVRF